jgi:hypothetical protein
MSSDAFMLDGMDGYIHIGSVFRDGLVHYLKSTWETDGHFVVKTKTIRDVRTACPYPRVVVNHYFTKQNVLQYSPFVHALAQYANIPAEDLDVQQDDPRIVKCRRNQFYYMDQITHDIYQVDPFTFSWSKVNDADLKSEIQRDHEESDSERDARFENVWNDERLVVQQKVRDFQTYAHWYVLTRDGHTGFQFSPQLLRDTTILHMVFGDTYMEWVKMLNSTQNCLVRRLSSNTCIVDLNHVDCITGILVPPGWTPLRFIFNGRSVEIASASQLQNICLPIQWCVFTKVALECRRDHSPSSDTMSDLKITTQHEYLWMHNKAEDPHERFRPAYRIPGTAWFTLCDTLFTVIDGIAVPWQEYLSSRNMLRVVVMP